LRLRGGAINSIQEAQGRSYQLYTRGSGEELLIVYKRLRGGAINDIQKAQWRGN